MLRRALVFLLAFPGIALAQWHESYHPYEDFVRRLATLQEEYPDMVYVERIGVSTALRGIDAVSVTAPGDVSGRNRIMVTAGLHADEWLAPASVMVIIDNLLAGYGTSVRVTEALQKTKFIFVPMVNPDGYTYAREVARDRRKSWWPKGTCTGVDLNRNFGYVWGGIGSSADPCSDVYRGTAAFSEPETKAVRDYILSTPQLVAHIDVHGGTAGMAYPWGHRFEPVANAAIYDMLVARMSEEAFSVNGFLYGIGQLSEVYYPHAGTLTDWAHAQGLYAFTFELSPEDGNQQVSADWIQPVGDELTPALLALSEFFVPEDPPPPPVPSCFVEETFESDAGWENTAESSCRTGIFTRGTPLQTFHEYRDSGLVMLQPDGDHTSGDGAAWYTQRNVDAWTGDVDGGVCVSESPTWSIPEASRLSLWFFHGQRDANPAATDDDFVRIEVSLDGGDTWEALVSEGNIQSHGEWRNVQLSIPAHSSVKLKLHAADNVDPNGDLVEFGVDDVFICEE
jgi:carboxypeptidase A2